MSVPLQGSLMVRELETLTQGMSAFQNNTIAKLHKQQWVKLRVAEMATESTFENESENKQEHMDESISVRLS